MKGRRKNMKEKISLIIKILIAILIIAILVSIGYIIVENNQLNIANKELKNEDEIVEKEFEYRVLDNTTDTIKGIVIIRETEGIQKIEYQNDKSEAIILDCYGKNRVDIDYNIQLNKDYNFKVTTASGTNNKILNLKESDIDNYIKIQKSNSDEQYDTAYIEYNNVDTITKYYKIGEDDNWIQYTNEIDISYLDYTEKDKNSVLVYAKEVDSNGNTIINSKEIEISGNKKRKLDIFGHYEKYEKDGMDLNGYGFSVVNRYNCQSFAFAKRYFLAGHSKDSASYSAIFKLDCSKFRNLKASELTASFIYLRDGGGSWEASSIDVYYVDGTNETINSSRNGNIYSATANITNKKIDYINFNIWRI